jgi:hypothetical protein
MQNSYAPQYAPQPQNYQPQNYQPKSNMVMYIGIVFIIIVIGYVYINSGGDEDEDEDEDTNMFEKSESDLEDTNISEKSDADLEEKAIVLEKEICGLRAEGISQACSDTIMGKTRYYWNKNPIKTLVTWKSSLKSGLHDTLRLTDDCGTTDRDDNWGAIFKEPYKSLLEKYAYPPNCRLPS